jgi:hypothetical protein
LQPQNEAGEPDLISEHRHASTLHNKVLEKWHLNGMWWDFRNINKIRVYDSHANLLCFGACHEKLSVRPPLLAIGYFAVLLQLEQMD